MSYTTRCPACGTMFKVVPDQLKISVGWVRCGHCSDVFDATLYLETWVPAAAAAAVAADPEPKEPASVDMQATAPADAAPFESTLMDLPADDQAVECIAEVGQAAAVADDSLVPPKPPAVPDEEPTLSPQGAGHGFSGNGVAEPPDAASVSIDSEPLAGAPALGAENPADFHAELARFAKKVAQTTHSATAFGPGPTPWAERLAGLQDVPATDPAPASPGADEPGFIRQARRRAFWDSRGVRAALALLALVLIGLLAAQWALHERDRLAASHPALVPLLTQVCAPLGCEIGPLRRIDAVVIDSSALARRLGNFYAFDVVLKNTADTALAMPALELSLTDTRDQVIARRVFLPSELPGAPAQLPAQGAVPVSLRLSISDAGSLSMAGYRALLFYP